MGFTWVDSIIRENYLVATLLNCSGTRRCNCTYGEIVNVELHRVSLFELQ